MQGLDSVCIELKYVCTWILRRICGRPVILRWDFSLLGSGVRKWSVQPWAFLTYVENLEMDNSLKWVLFIKESGQITSDTLWKYGEVFLLRIWRIVLFLRAVVNILIQTLIIPPWLLLCKMIISQLELGPPVVTLMPLNLKFSRYQRSTPYTVVNILKVNSMKYLHL